MKIKIPGSVSLQNPAFSPDGKRLCLTDWRGGYNEGNAHVQIYDLATKGVEVIATGGGVINCSEPGACWNASSGIIFSSDRWGDEDQVCRWTAGADTQRLTKVSGHLGIEPSWHKDGKLFVFEQHVNDVERGSIMVGTVGNFVTSPVTTAGDCRQPNWSPDGQWIVYQKMDDDWRIHIIKPDGTGDRKLVKGTDITWHPDSSHLIYSNEDGLLRLLDLVTMKATPVGPQDGYHGAPSISPDGKRVACEAYSTDDPDGGPGTWIEIFDL